MDSSYTAQNIAGSCVNNCGLPEYYNGIISILPQINLKKKKRRIYI